MTSGSSKPYVIDDLDEPQRLEQQAALAGLEQHFQKFRLPPKAKILDAGCGSGSMTRLLARQAPDSQVIGVDTNVRYLAMAEQMARAQGIANITFKEGDIFHLPFEDESFDLIWCKYVLQWVNNPIHAVTEFKRVTRRGGCVVCCHFDGFGVTHYPVVPELQADAEVFFQYAIDPFVGRKQYWMFQQAGYRDITVDCEPDRSFSVYGKIDAARRRNWIAQLEAAFPAIVKSLGSEARAQAFVEQFLAYQDREDTASSCTLYFVTGYKS